MKFKQRLFLIKLGVIYAMAHKLLLIEDEPIIAKDLTQKLEGLGYNVVGFCDEREELLRLVKDEEPDVFITDIILEGKDYSGIDLMEEVFKFYKAPIIFLTGNSEMVTVQRATSIYPATFLLKPFRIAELSINIELAIKNYNRPEGEKDKLMSISNDALFLRHNNELIKVCKDDIIYIQADGAYSKVITKEKSIHQTMNLKRIEGQVRDQNFRRLSRKYVVNVKHIESINGTVIHLSNGKKIKLSKSKRKDIVDLLPLIRT